MTTTDSKIAKIQTHFQALSSLAPELNAASDDLTQAVALLDEALKKLNIGLPVWVAFRFGAEPPLYHTEQIGYDKVGSKWGIALRCLWGNEDIDDHNEDGPWLFNEAPRDMRLYAVDKIPEVIELLGKAAFDTTKKIQEKAQEVRQFADAIENITKQAKAKENLEAVRKAVVARGGQAGTGQDRK